MVALILIDAGPIIAYYSLNDKWHKAVRKYLETVTDQLVTTSPCLTEALYVLRSDYKVQNELLLDVARGLYRCEPLIQADFSRIAELNAKYHDLPGDFADLSLIVISERLGINKIASLDSDFTVYRRYGKKHFVRVFPTT